MYYFIGKVNLIMSPKVCIILVNYKSANLSIECVNSILQITYQNYEIIIVDNNSQDDSIDKLKKKYNTKVHIVESKENLGFSGGNRLGVDKALTLGAEYILLLNNDTEVDKNFLGELVKYANSETVTVPKILYYDKQKVLWYGGGQIIVRKGKMQHLGIGETDCSKANEKPVSCDFATGCCCLIHRNIIEEIGLFDESFFMYYEDADFCIRLKYARKKILYVPTSKIWHKVSSSSGGEMSPLSIYYMERNRMHLLRKHWRLFTPFGILYVLITRIIKYVFLFLKRDQMLKYYLAGFHDFFKGSLGKSNRKFG